MRIALVPATFLPWNVPNAEPNGSGECVYMDTSGAFGDRNCSEGVAFICECRGP